MPQEESVLRLGRDEALEAARLWQECGDAREFACRVLGGVMNALMDSEAQQMCGASRNERSDGRENSRNGYRPRSLKTAVGDVELEIPKLRHGTYYPEGMARAMVARRHLGGRHRAGDVRVRRVHPQGRARGVQAGHILAVELGGLEPLLRPRRRGGGVPPPRPFGHAVLLPVARRHLHELQGRLVGRLAGRRDRDRLGADGRKHFLGCDVVDTESEDSWAAFLGGCASAGWPAFASWSPTATPGSWPPSRACSRAAPGSAA